MDMNEVIPCVVRGKVPGKYGKENRMPIEIVATQDYRGEDDKEIFFFFREPPIKMVIQAFDQMICKGNGISKGAEILYDLERIRRVGYGTVRISVKLIQPNYKLCEPETIKALIERFMRQQYPISKFRWLSIYNFLNVKH